MKLAKLDMIVIGIVLLSLVGVGIAGILSDPALQSPRVGYLYPAFGGIQNVHMLDIDDPDNPVQLTDTAYGVFDFAFSPDGRWLVFAEKNQDAIATLRLMDVHSRQVVDLVDCIAASAYCTTPSFSPDGRLLAYQRSESLNNSYGLSRIWLVDMTSPNYETVPLLADSQVVGHSPVWSADGNTLAFYSADTTQPGILIYDFVSREPDGVQLRFIPSSHGSMGTVSPNGQELIFPEVIQRNEQLFSYLRIADLLDKEFAAFTNPDNPTDDVFAQWSPDGDTVVMARRYTDDRWTMGHQTYLLSASDDTQTLTAVDYNENYNTSYFRWNHDGTRLVLQRFPLQNEDGTPNRDARPEVWVYDVASQTAQLLVNDAFIPQWASP
jgi:Tol biopolymer transport system component